MYMLKKVVVVIVDFLSKRKSNTRLSVDLREHAGKKKRMNEEKWGICVNYI